jgi:hypothetical protein
MPEPAPERTPPDDTTPVAGGSYEWYRREVERLRGQLGEASEALRAVGKAALTVAPTLCKPYRDAPETSPWEQFMEQPARRAYELGARIRRELKERS